MAAASTLTAPPPPGTRTPDLASMIRVDHAGEFGATRIDVSCRITLVERQQDRHADVVEKLCGAPVVIVWFVGGVRHEDDALDVLQRTACRFDQRFAQLMLWLVDARRIQKNNLKIVFLAM